MRKTSGRYNFTLNLYNNRRYEADVYVDGVKVQNKEKRFSAPMRYEHSTDNNVVNVVFKKTFEINSKLYILKFLFYYILSVFGIFDVREKNFRTMEVEFFVDLQKAQTVSVRLAPYAEGGAAVLFDPETVSMQKNVFYEDQTAKARQKTLKKIKILFTVAVFVIAAAIAIFKIVN
mgnify:CR=1 FL=1